MIKRHQQATSPGTSGEDGQSLLEYGGLSNDVAENNCFLNSVIQILYNADFFRRTLRNLAALELGQYHVANVPANWRHKCSNHHNNNPNNSHLLPHQSFCIFCELVKLFSSLRVGQQNHRRFHDPNILRLALQDSVSTLSHSTTFRLKQMNDSVECFEQILKTLHGYTSSTAYESRRTPHMAECTSETCICHRQFSLTVSEQKTCSCGLANSELQFACDLVERVYVVPLLRAANRQSNQVQQSSFSDLLRIAQSSVDPPTVCKGAHCGRLVHKTRRLMCKPDAIAISLTFPSACPDDLTLKQVIDLIEPTVEPTRLYSSSQQFPEPFQLSGIICYHGQHYLAICYHTTRKVWNVISDSVVKHIGNSWQDVRAYLRRAPCIPCLLLYTNPQAVALPRASSPQPLQSSEPIYFDRQAVQDMLAKTLKFPIHVQPNQSANASMVMPQGYASITRKSSSLPSDSASSGYDSKSSVSSGSHSCNDSTNSSCSPSPPGKQSLANHDNTSTTSLDRLSSLVPPPPLAFPNQENIFVLTHFKQTDVLCSRLLSQLGQRLFTESLATCQQAANVLRTALISQPHRGIPALIENVNSPQVVTAKRRIDWLALCEGAIMKKINPSQPAAAPQQHPAKHALSTFQSVAPVAVKPPKVPEMYATTGRQQSKKIDNKTISNLRSSLSNIQQLSGYSKEAEDIPNNRCNCGSSGGTSSEQSATGTLPRRGLKMSPSSSDILSSNQSTQIERPLPHQLSEQKSKPRFVAVRGPRTRTSQPIEQTSRPSLPPPPPSITSEIESLCSSGHGSVSSNSNLSSNGSHFFNSSQSCQRKSSLRSQRNSLSSIGSNSVKSVKFNDQVAVITEDFLGPNGDPIDTTTQTTVAIETIDSSTDGCENYTSYVAKLTERTRSVVYPTTSEQSEQFYVRRAAVPSTNSNRSTAKLNDDESQKPDDASPPDSSDNTEEEDTDSGEEDQSTLRCMLCNKKLKNESTQYCIRCQAYLSRFSSPSKQVESEPGKTSAEVGVTFTAVADGAIF